MVNIQRQVEYWITGADEDIVTANILIHERRILHGLFFCHLVIEKGIKAHCVLETSAMAPRSHNLNYLMETSRLKIDEDTQIFIGILMKYQLQGRYPDYDPAVPDMEQVKSYLYQTHQLLKWLKEKL